jgi:hypothetical protein
VAVKIAGPARQRGRGSAIRRHRGRWLAGLPVLAAGAGLLWCYARLAATFPGGSDGASSALEARDLLYGNVLLRGWTLTDVSFYTTELPEYAAVELARGLSPAVPHAAAALTYVLLLVFAALLARGRARGAEGWSRALIAAGIMLAPQLGNGVHVLLGQPDHVGTQVLILGTFLVLERGPRRWYTAGGAGLLLAAATVADKIAIVDAVVPLAFGALLHAVWARRPAAHRFEFGLAAAAGAGAGAALLALTLIGRAGGFTLLPVQTGLSGPAGVPAHLSLAWHGLLSLYGADVTAAAPGLPTVLACLHAPGIALAVAAFAVVAWHVPRQHDLVSDVLAVAIVVNLAGFVASIIPATAFDTREIAALLPFGAVLAGRVFGPWLARPLPWRAGLAVAGACQLAALGYGTAQPPAADPQLALAAWLAAHHLTCGLGTFNDGNSTTLDSGGAVRVLSVTWLPPPHPAAPLPNTRGDARSALPLPRPGGAAVPRLYQSSASWYDPATSDADFVVTGGAGGTADLIPRKEILALAGPPARTYQVGTFTVMVWDTNLLALLGRPASRLPGDIGHP